MARSGVCHCQEQPKTKVLRCNSRLVGIRCNVNKKECYNEYFLLCSVLRHYQEVPDNRGLRLNRRSVGIFKA